MPPRRLRHYRRPALPPGKPNFPRRLPVPAPFFACTTDGPRLPHRTSPRSPQQGGSASWSSIAMSKCVPCTVRPSSNASGRSVLYLTSRLSHLQGILRATCVLKSYTPHICQLPVTIVQPTPSLSSLPCLLVPHNHITPPWLRAAASPYQRPSTPPCAWSKSFVVCCIPVPLAQCVPNFSPKGRCHNNYKPNTSPHRHNALSIASHPSECHLRRSTLPPCSR